MREIIIRMQIKETTFLKIKDKREAFILRKTNKIEELHSKGVVRLNQ